MNAFFAALFVAMMVVSAAFISSGRDGFTGAPGARASLAWAGLFALLAALAFVNMRGTGDGAGKGLLILNLAAVLPLSVGAVVADGIRFLCLAAAFPFAATALLLAPRALRKAG